MPQIAGELAVGTLITGSVTRTGDRLHLTVSLVASVARTADLVGDV